MGRKKKTTGTFDDWFSNYSQQNGIDISGANSSGSSYSQNYQQAAPRKKATFDDWFTGYAEDHNIDLTQTQQRQETPSYARPTYKKINMLPTNQQAPGYTQNPLVQAAQNKVSANNGSTTASALQRLGVGINTARNTGIIPVLEGKKEGLRDYAEAARHVNESYGQETIDLYKNAEKQYNDIDAQIQELKRQNAELNRQAKMQGYQDLTRNPDFTQNSGYQSTANGREFQYSPTGYGLTETGFDDYMYDFINRNPQAVLARHLNASQGDVRIGTDDAELENMTDDQIRMFNYLYQTDRDRAYEYIEDIRPELRAIQAQKEKDEWSAFAQENPVLSSVVSVPNNLVSSIDSLIGMGVSKLDGNEIDPNAGYFRGRRAQNAIRGTVGEMAGETLADWNAQGLQAQEAHQAYLEGRDLDQAMNEIYTKEHLEELKQTNFADKLRKFGNTAYGSIMSQADNMMNVALTGGMSGAALTLMSMTAMPDTISSAKERGLSDEQAFGLGVISGAAEYFTEKVSLEALLDMDSIARKGLARYIGVNALTEGSEEVASDFINFVAEHLIAGDKSEFAQTIADYEASGMNHEDAVKQAWADQVEQTLYSFMGGALAGGGTAVGFGISNTVSKAQLSEYGRSIKEQLPAISPLRQMDDTKLAEFFINVQQTKEAEARSNTALTQAAEQLVSPAESAQTEEIAEEVTNESPEEENVPKPQAELRNQQIMAPLRVYSEAQMAEESERNYIDKIAQDRFGTTGYEVYRSALQNNGVQSISERMQTLGDFTKAYNAGMNNQAMPTNLRISEQSAKAAYATGQNAVLDQYRDNNGKFKKGFTSYYGSEAGLAVDTDIVRKAVAEGLISQKDMDGFADLGVRLGTKIYLEETMPQNGWYEKGGIGVALDADNGMRHVLSHEFVHRLQEAAPEEYETLKSYIADYIGSEDLERSLSEYYNLGKSQGVSISQTVAMDEVVADWVAGHVVSGDLEWTGFVERASQTQEGRTFLQKIRDFFRNIVNKLKGSKNPDVIQLSDAMVKAQKLLDDTLNAAQRNVQNESNRSVSQKFIDAMDQTNQVIEDANGNPVAGFHEDGSVSFSLRSFDDSGRKIFNDYLNKLVKSGELLDAEADDMRNEMETVYKICKDFADTGKYAPFTAWSNAEVIYDSKGRPVFTAIKKNSEYTMNVDFSTICKKRRTLDAVFREMINRGLLEQLDFNMDESAAMVVNINNLIRKRGFEAACALCFVEARRYRQQQTATTFRDMWNEIVESMYPDKSKIAYFNFGQDSTVKDVPDGIHTMDNKDLDLTYVRKLANAKNEKGKPLGTAEAKAARLLLKDPSQRKLMRVGDMMASTGFENMQIQNPQLMKVYNSKKGTGGAKSSFGDVQYLNEIVRSSKFGRRAAYAVSGVRIQSFSDYVPRMVFDYVQVIGDLAAKKLPAHAYTKEVLFAKQFGLTGAKINLSLVPDVVKNGVAPGLDAKGNYVWNEEGTFPYKEAMELQQAEGYKENCGTIAVGISDEQIRKMLADPTIQMVIPYHKSSLNPIVAAMTNVDRFTNYEDSQNTKDQDGKTLSSKNDFAWDDKLFELTHDKNDKLLPRSQWGNVQDLVKEYVDWCDARGYTPKFSQFLYMEDGSINPGYYKLLEDFALLDNDGNFKPQGDVELRFPTESDAFGSMASLIKQGLSEDTKLEKKRSAKISGIVDEIQTMINSGTIAENKRFSLRTSPAFYSQLERQVEAFKGDKIGASSLIPYLKGKGVKDEEIKWTGLATFLEGKKSVSKEDVLQYVRDNQLEITESILTDTPSSPIWSNGTTKVNADRYYTYSGEEYKNVKDFKDKAIAIAESRSKVAEARGESYDPNDIIFDIDEEAGYMTAEIYDDVFLEAYRPDTYELMENDFTNDTMSRWDDYKLDGGENYREILFKIPGSDYSNNAMKVHWGNNKGVLVHARVQDFNTENGKVLFVEEIQSDWHNAGAKIGYKTDITALKEKTKKTAELREVGLRYELYVDGEPTGFGTTPARVRRDGADAVIDDLLAGIFKRKQSDMVEDAPFKNNYTDFALKSLLRMAAEGDYDYLSWTSGEIQEDRWSSEYAEGYRIEYDQDIPKFLKKYGKQWGANLTEIRIKEGDSQFDNEWPVQAIPVNAEMKESVLTEGQPRFSLRSDSEGRKLSKGQQEYFKDSKILDEDGNLRVVYHGSSEAFNTFDISKGRSGMDIQGSFFSPWEIDAAGYGENVRAYYLNITNPAPEQVGYQALRRFQGQNYAGTKAREYLESLGYDGVNNGDEEYIAFYPEQIKLVDNQNPTNDKDVRYSLRNDGYNVNGATARWTDERIDSLIREYGASNPDYSQAYAVLMNPRDYLKLTLSDNMLDRWNKGSNMPEHPETYSLDEERLRENTQTPFLSIYSKDGTEVQGHEGRHRMRALLEAGITSVPVVIRDTDTKYSKQTLDSMTLTAQDFGEGPVNNGAAVTLTNLVPIKETNRDELTRLFGGNADVQFSLRGSRDIVAASERDSRIRNEYMEAAASWRSNMTALSDVGKSGFNTNMTALVRDYNKNIDKNTSERIVGEIRSLTREMVRNHDMTYSEISQKANVIAAKILWGTSDSRKFPDGSLLFNEDAARAVDDIRNDIMAQILKSTTRGEGKYQALSKEFADYRKRANDKITEVRRKRDAKLEEIQAKKREEIARKVDSSERTTLLKRMNRLNKIMKTTSEANQEMIKDFIGEFNLVAKSMTAGKAENLADLSDYIDNMMRIDPDFMPTERTIKDVARFGKKNVADLTIEEVAQLNEALLNLENAIRTSKRLIDSEYKQHISELGNEIIEGVRNTKGIANSKIGVFNWFQQTYDKTLATPVIRPETEILRLVGFDRNNPLYKLTFGEEGSLASGQKEMVRYKWQANKRYTDRFVNDKQFADSIMGKKARACEITGKRADGTIVNLKVTPDMLMALYMHAQNKHNFRHFGEWNDESGHTQHGGGITIPDFDLYRKGKIQEAYRVGTRDGNLITMTRSALNAAFKQLTEKEMSFIRSAQAYYSEMSQPEINRVSNLLLGYSIANEENYFRINTDSNYRGTNMDAIKFDGTIEGMGWTKERIEGARNAILLIPLTEQFQRDIDAHAKYIGMAIPVRNFNKAYGVNRQSYDENGDFTGTETSVQSAITGKWGSGATDYIQKLMSDVQNPQTSSESWTKIFGKLRSFYAGSVLALNAGVAIKQAASYPTAAAEIGWGPLIKAFGNTRLQGKMDMDLINKYSPLMYLRTQGMGYQELADLKNLNKGWLNRALNSKALNWIQDMDVMTVKKLWKASEYYVRDNFKDLQVGTEEYYKKVGEVHSRVIERTQPNYTTLQRGEILRSDSDFIRMTLGMFKTQPFQNFSILFEATGELQAACRAYKVSPNEVTEAMRTAAVKKMARALSSQIVASLVFALMQAAWDWTRGRDDKYKDKEGRITFASAFKQIGINMGSNAFGMIPLGSVIYEAVETTVDTIAKNNGGEAIFNATAYGLDASTATGIVNDLVDAVQSLTNISTSVDLESKNTTEQHVRGVVDILSSAVQAAGYPADNFVKDGQAVAVNVFRLLGATGQMSKYEQEFYSKRIFTAVSKDKKGYLEILYNAYDNDTDAYNKLYSIYTESDGFATSSKTSKEYIDDKMNAHIKEQTKNQNRDRAGLTESQLNDYQEALDRFDANHNGSYTQEETYNALMSIALSQKQKETLWDENGWKKSFSEYKPKK